jgi:hypothetical protein
MTGIHRTKHDVCFITCLLSDLINGQLVSGLYLSILEVKYIGLNKEEIKTGIIQKQLT